MKIISVHLVLCTQQKQNKNKKNSFADNMNWNDISFKAKKEREKTHNLMMAEIECKKKETGIWIKETEIV